MSLIAEALPFAAHWINRETGRSKKLKVYMVKFAAQYFFRFFRCAVVKSQCDVDID